jgi:hypothetical protein
VDVMVDTDLLNKRGTSNASSVPVDRWYLCK